MSVEAEKLYQAIKNTKPCLGSVTIKEIELSDRECETRRIAIIDRELSAERSRTIEECKAAVKEMRSAYSTGEYYSRMGIHLEINKIIAALNALKEKP